MGPTDRTPCPDVAPMLAWQRGELVSAEANRIARHVTDCGSCQAIVESENRTSETRAEVDRPGPPTLDPETPTAVDSTDPTQAGATEPLSPGTVIGGRYKLLEAIGEGGMGVVYRAQQVEPVRRLVAIKLIKEGMDTGLVLARFAAERQALALMDHPHIARVLDAGASATGRPYFVMELVQGVPITAYCDTNRLNTRARLELFVAACRAIQHAHQKGIIHRDIKPSNVLVARYDGVATVKVIDFGIAKAIGQPLTEQTLVTNFGAVVGTLEYMSPEQAELDSTDVDTRSDVYALGVLLYELLTGTTPLDRRRIGRAALFEVLRLVREEEPPRPSTRLSASDALPAIASCRGIEPTRLAPLLRGDLDWIAMRALEKDRARRYETANGLARDVERFLNDEAVEASPPSARYRLGKFARKHRGALRATIGILGVLIATTTVSTWQAIRASRAEAREHAELAKSEARYALAREAIETFYAGASEDVLLREPQMKELRGKLLNGALGFYRKLQAEVERRQQTAPSVEIQAELAASFEKLADLTADVGDKRAALTGYEQAVPFRRALTAAAPLATAPRRALARLHGRLGRVFLDIGPPDASAEWHQQAARDYETAALLDGGNDEDRLQAASARTSVGQALATTVRTDEAIRAFDRAIAELRRLVRSEPTAFGPRRELAITLLQAGYLRLNGMPRPLDAIPLIDESNEIHADLARTHGDDINLRQDWAKGLHYAAMCREHIGPIEATLPFYTQELAALEPVLRHYPTLSAVRQSIADVRIGIGITLVELPGRERDSLIEYDQAAELLEPLVAENPDVPIFRSRLAATESSRAYSLDRLGDYEGAIRAYGRAIILRGRLAHDQPSVTMYRGLLGEDYGHLGDVYRHATRPAAALPLYRRALATMGDLPTHNVIARLNMASWSVAIASLLGHDPDQTLGDRLEADRQALIDRALGLLRMIADSGFHDAQSLTSDPNFAPLQSNPTYQSIVLDMAFPDPPFPD